MEPPVSCSAGGNAAEKGRAEALLAHVDHFLVEALGNPRHRLTVLRMELDIQRFMQNPDQHQFEYQHYPTSYLRCAAHRVAQYYGLQTMALDNIGDGSGSRIIVRKTLESRVPPFHLSEIPANESESEKTEQVKIAICRRPKGTSLSNAIGLEIKSSPFRTVEEREEEYEKARARIFSGSNGPEMEGQLSTAPADGRSLCSSRDEQDSLGIVAEETEMASTKDGASRVAIFRDREKDRNDPDYNRSYDRYARAPVPSQSFSLEACGAVQSPFFQYGVGFCQLGPVPIAQTSVNYRPSIPTIGPFDTFGCSGTHSNVVYMQWPSPAMLYAQSYEHFRCAAYQVPFYQQPLSFEPSLQPLSFEPSQYH